MSSDRFEKTNSTVVPKNELECYYLENISHLLWRRREGFTGLVDVYEDDQRTLRRRYDFVCKCLGVFDPKHFVSVTDYRL